MADDDTYDLAPAPKEPPREAPFERVRPPSLPTAPKARAPAPPATPPPLVDPNAPAKKVTCPHCGFERYGPAKGRCPKCAAALDAAERDFLKYAPAGWVRTAASGWMLIALATLAHLAGAGIRYANLSLAANLHAGAGVVLVLGVFLATRADPRPEGVKTDWASRIMAIISFILWVAIAASLRKNEEASMKALIVPTLLLHVILCITLSLHCRRLAMRVPDDSIAFQGTLSGSLASVACALMAFIHTFDFDKFYFLSGVFFCSFPLILGLLLIFLWTVITMLRLALNMRACAAEGDDVGTRTRSEEMPNSDLV